MVSRRNLTYGEQKSDSFPKRDASKRRLVYLKYAVCMIGEWRGGERLR